MIFRRRRSPCGLDFDLTIRTRVQARAVLFRLEKKDKSPASLQHAGGFVCCSLLPLPISIAHFEI